MDQLIQQTAASKEREAAEGVVISGMSGIYPSAQHVAGLANILYNKENPISSDHGRWKYDHPEVAQYLGKLSGLDKFDAQFFKVHFRLSNTMDSMSRKILEQAYQAIYDAGVSPEELYGRKVGVYVGTSFSESEKACFYVASSRSGFGIAGCNKSMFANRISYWLNAKGPSMAVDDACCSSTAAVELAYQAIVRGDCEAAIVAGANLCLHPQSSINYSRIIKLCKDGKTRSFDEKAAGCVKSEAINVLFLQKAKDARRVYAEIVHVKTEFTSFMEGETGPVLGLYRDPLSVTNFLKTFYDEARIPTQAIEYVEAFGSADPEVDKVELEAISEVLCKERYEPLLIGSVISNIGYTSAATGISAITKVLLGYHTGVLAGNLHCETPRRDVAALREGRMRVLQDHAPFRRSYAAVNGLSITGVNSHVLLYGHYKPKDPLRYKCNIGRLVTISARQETSVKIILNDLKSRPIDPEEISLLHHIHSTRITGHLGRGFIILDTNEKNNTISVCEEAGYCDDKKRELWFVYSGMGSQWAGMGVHLMRIPIFAAAIERCQRALKPKGVDIVHIITSKDKTIFDNILNSFVGIAAIQIGLTDILREIGIVPDKIIGHSVGELGCAYADNCFTAEEMILSAYSRGLVSIQTQFIRGSMAAIGVGYQQMIKMCPPEIEVACHNSPNSCTISGPANVMTAFVTQLTAKNIFAKEVPCSNIAYHSRYIAKAGPSLLKYLSEVIKTPKQRSDRWISTSVPMENWDKESAKYSSAEYHTNNLLSPVLFEESSRLIPADAVLVEVAPHGLLQAILKRALPESCRNIPLTRRAHPDNARLLLEAIGQLYMLGYTPSVHMLYPKVKFPVSTGTPMLSHLVDWAHHEDWTLPVYASAHRITAASTTFVISIHDEEHSYLQGNVIQGKVVYPHAATLMCVWDTLAMTLGVQRRGMSVQFRDVMLNAQPILHERRQLRLAVALQRATGRFEVMDEQSKVASGFITSNLNVIDTTPFKHDAKYNVDQNTIYQMLYLRDFSYRGTFRSIHSANSSFSKACILWQNNWETLIDAMLQLNVLRQPHETVSQPQSIRKICIDLKQHEKDEMLRIGDELVKIVQVSPDVTRCKGVIIGDVKLRNLPIVPDDNNVYMRTLKLAPYLQNEKSSSKLGPEYNLSLQQKLTNGEMMLQCSSVGDLSSLKWVQTPTSPISNIRVKVYYAGVGDIDVKRAMGISSFVSTHETGKGFGMDFSGITDNGQRVMGIVPHGAICSSLNVSAHQLWPVPAHWSLEDAATVPLAYCLACYCLGVRCEMQTGSRVLVTGGAGALGQAVISVALAHQCEVFTTVSSVSKKNFLLKMFPELQAKNIGYSRDLAFGDMVLNNTNGKGVDIIICNAKGELKNVSLKCAGKTSFIFDVVQLHTREDYTFGMSLLVNETGYIRVDLTNIFKSESIRDLKKLQRMVGEGVARGWVRPLSRVTYSPLEVPRAFRLLAAGNQRGKVLLHLQAAQDVLVQPRIQCSSNLYHAIFTDNDLLAIQLADKLISRGARKLLLHRFCPLLNLDYKIWQWREMDVEVNEAAVNPINRENFYNLLRESHILKFFEGIYLIISEPDKHTEIKSVLSDLDCLSRQADRLKYFGVLSTKYFLGSQICISRKQSCLPATMLQLPEIRKVDDINTSEAISPREAVDALEQALCSSQALLLGRVSLSPKPSLLTRLETIAEIKIPEDLKTSSTLAELGVDEVKLNAISVYLRDMYNIFISAERMPNVTLKMLMDIEKSLSDVKFEDVDGLKAFFSYVDSDELLATTDIVLMPTLSSGTSMRGDEFDVSETHLVIVPGVEGHHARFRTLCERLKLPALVLQPGLDRPRETVPELANRYAQILLEKTALKSEFYLLGYESGILVALEMAAILEDKDFQGTIFCIGSAPEDLINDFKEKLSGFDSEESLQNAILRHMFTLMTGSDCAELPGVHEGESWTQRVEAAVRALLGRSSHSAQYARQLMESALGRVTQLLRHSIRVRALRSQLVQLQPASRAASARLQPHSRQPVSTHKLRAPLALAAEDLRCAAIINSYLSERILQAFSSKNLCDTYLLKEDSFMTFANSK